MVTFQDQFGQERWDCVMLDPGASAFLMGYGPFSRYVNMLEQRGFPKEHLKFLKCDRKFFFGGDACSQCRWTVMLPVAVSGRCGFIQAYILPWRDTYAHGQANYGGHWTHLGLQATSSST